MLKHLPNLITLARMALIPWIALALYEAHYAEAFALFALAVFSDGVDGFLARRYGWQSRLGAILDPLADKGMILAALFALVMAGLLPAWLLVLSLTRDFSIVALAVHYNFFVRPGFVPRPSILGKLHTVLEAALILVVILEAWQGWGLDTLLDVLLVMVVLSTLTSAVDYYRQYRRLPGKDAAP
ncbi:MAG: CDP-alcohol phosphatidyltransferase family protein [Halothiobacillaceae bacterium]|nr:CDP-alcohol phosphatidyltransferase family protein [Halothiobacillaceae bacterium]